MKYRIFLFVTSFFLFVAACNSPNYTPKPRGYFRIDFPKHEYQVYDSLSPYLFEYPLYASIEPYKKKSEKYWFNIDIQRFNAKIYLSYKNLNGDFKKLSEESRSLAYKHTVKADAIEEIVFENDSTRVYGVLYGIKGDVASSVQFFLTDSSSHFLRGALYFNNHPNKDSLAPVIDFLNEDIKHFIESLEWRNIPK